VEGSWGQRATGSSAAACITIHPGSGSPRKNWPAENWRRLIDGLPGPVSLILGEAEAPQWSAWATRSGDGQGADANKRLGVKPLHLFLNRPLEELVDHFAQCRLFLGHDSGISHLAAACGARCVLLFGPTGTSRVGATGSQRPGGSLPFNSRGVAG
jgi:heptosyltransferase III